MDLGGQWVHGEKNNVAFELAYPLGLLDKPDDCEVQHGQMYFDSKGNNLSNDFDEKVRTFIDKHLSGKIFNSDNSCKSIGEYIEKK